MKKTSGLRKILEKQWLPLAAALVAVLLCLPALWVGWHVDDHVHRLVMTGFLDEADTRLSPFDLFAFLDGDEQRIRRAMDEGLLPWWTLENLRIAFWRPLSALSHWIDYALWPESPALMHLQSLLWYGGLVLAAGLLYRRILTPVWAAGLAAVFYAVDDAHAMPAGWLANRNACLAVFFGLLALWCYDRWRRDEWRAGIILGPVFLVLGLLSGEAALATCAYLFSHALFLDKKGWPNRVLAMLPYAITVLLWFGLYHGLGYGTWGSGFYYDPASEPLAYMGAVIERAPILLADLLGSVPSSLYALATASEARSSWLIAVGFLVVFFPLLVPLLKRDKKARFFLTGLLLSLLPVCSTMPHGRLLLFAGFGGMGLLAQFVSGTFDRAGWLPSHRALRSITWVMVWITVIVNGVLAPHALPLSIWATTSLTRPVEGAADSAPMDEALAGQTLVLVNPSYPFLAHLLPTIRTLKIQPVPAHLRILVSGLAPINMERPDERTLIVRPEDGFIAAPFDNIYRGSNHVFSMGDRIELSGMTVEIRRVSGSGRPLEAAFRFSVDLEDRSLRWLQWDGGAYIPFTLPGVGETGHLPAVPPIF